MTTSEPPWPNRTERVLAALSHEWQPFVALPLEPHSALEAKQLTGALVWLRNRGKIVSRLSRSGVMLWRLP